MNMKKNLFNWMLAAMLMCGLGMTFVSCSDDDDEPKSEEQKEQEVQQKASNFWNVVGQLVSVDDVTDDYEGKTFEPTYGIADPTNATTRIVNTNDMQTAAQRFANLVDAKGINENTGSYTWSDPEIGSMTYTKGGDPSNWATVDVDIKAVPGLQRIIYREGGAGENGKFDGRAYYRFGDVVSREVKAASDPNKTNDERGKDNGGKITEYWICVRPAFGPEGKQDSHWVCVNTVTDKNYKYYKASTGNEYWLPTNLGTDKENMQNFAELLWAITNPTTWYENVNNYHTDGMLWGFDGVPFFTDFKLANLKYHNQYFWQKVQKGWTKNEVVEKALNLNNMSRLSEAIDRDGVHLLYKGYSWWFTTSWDCELWEAVYTNGGSTEEKNLHHVEYNNPEKNMKSINKFDVREMGKATENYKDYFNNDNQTVRWAIRHATGKELSSNKKFDVNKAIDGVTEVYRYYKQYPEQETKQTEPGKPEIADRIVQPSEVTVGTIVSNKGKFYDTLGDVESGETAVALVCYNTRPVTASHGTVYHFLAIGLYPAVTADNKTKTFKWASHMKSCGVRISLDTEFNTLTTTYCGVAQTRTLVAEAQEDLNCHPAAWQCYNYVQETFAGAIQMSGTYTFYAPSQWFLPSPGEWVLFLQGMGVWDERDSKKVLETIKNIYSSSGVKGGAWGTYPSFDDGVWTSVEASDEQAYVLKIDDQFGSRFELVRKDVEKQVFPFIYY